MTKSFIFKNSESEYYELSYLDAQFLAATPEQVDEGVLPEVTAEDVDKFCSKEGWHNFYDLAKKIQAPQDGVFDAYAN
jgi:hypothetical protein